MHHPVGVILRLLKLNTEATFSAIANAISERPRPIESEFTELARHEPLKLVAWIEDGTLNASQLTFAAESLSKSSESDLVVPCLFRLLTHTSSLVREGAVYGLEGHLEYRGVRSRLGDIASDDPREGVREAAREALE
jgi:hypothetical protein